MDLRPTSSELFKKFQKMERISVLKTYKIYIGGKFPRTESGRYYQLKAADGKALANVCLSSRKDVRNAVVAARKALGGWAERAAFNRSQIIYRIAEMLESRREQFEKELVLQGSKSTEAAKELDMCIDRIVYYAGWCDKYQQIYSSVNPVSSSHFNFSVLEPMGVVGVVAPQSSGLLGLVSAIMPVVCGGNTVVVLASERYPLSAVSFCEVLNSSDVPGGVVNVLTGKHEEMKKTLSTHMDVNAIHASIEGAAQRKEMELEAVVNLKRIVYMEGTGQDRNDQGPEKIHSFQEVKTTWHPIEQIGGATSSY
jgi:acyl-CoA reductase-like NAD-dependent aldehyde dehydrogenase